MWLGLVACFSLTVVRAWAQAYRSGWNGVLAPAGVARDIIARLNAIIVKAVNTSEMRETLIKQGFEAQAGTPEQFAAFIRGELAQNEARPLRWIET